MDKEICCFFFSLKLSLLSKLRRDAQTIRRDDASVQKRVKEFLSEVTMKNCRDNSRIQ